LAEPAGWYRKTVDGWLLSIHIQPGAKRSEVAGTHGDALKIRIAAPPLEGRANAALEAFIAKALGIAKSRVAVTKGLQSREKVIAVHDSAADPAILITSGSGTPKPVRR
jgi:uncharacterized protein (TIGR00251 family)